MKASIAESARAATAMGNVVEAVAANAKAANESLALYKDANIRQSRAYLTIGLGPAFKQNTTTNFRFEVRMLLQNVGNTPAYKAISETHAAIFPFPLPQDFQPPPFVNTASSVNTLGPHQNYILTGYADRIYPDDEIKEIENGTTKRLYVYGRVIYEDAFGINRQTNFFQSIIWLCVRPAEPALASYPYTDDLAFQCRDKFMRSGRDVPLATNDTANRKTTSQRPLQLGTTCSK